jgi:hypothetical protein
MLIRGQTSVEARGWGVGRVVCPRCGRVGYLTLSCTRRGDREYCYWRFEHFEVVGGRRKKVTCYLGPVDRPYIYVEKVHGLGLTNILHQDVSTLIYKAVVGFIDRAMMTMDRERLLQEVKRLSKRLAELQALLQALEEKLEEKAQPSATSL